MRLCLTSLYDLLCSHSAESAHAGTLPNSRKRCIIIPIMYSLSVAPGGRITMRTVHALPCLPLTPTTTASQPSKVAPSWPCNKYDPAVTVPLNCVCPTRARHCSGEPLGTREAFLRCVNGAVCLTTFPRLHPFEGRCRPLLHLGNVETILTFHSAPPHKIFQHFQQEHCCH